jgi:uncharacterized protein (DUF885 family)
MKFSPRFRHLLIVFLLQGCVSHPQDNSTADQRFDDFTAAFIVQYWQHFPGLAISNGYYKHADTLPVPSQANRNKLRKFLIRSESQLAAIDTQSLSASNQTDNLVLHNHIKRLLWNLDVLKPFQWQSDNYNVAREFNLILNTDYEPLNDRLRTVSTRMGHIEEYYAAARANLIDPTLEHTLLAIEQNEGGLGIWTSLLPNKIQQSTLPAAEKQQLLQAASSAAEIIESYINWLEQRQSGLEQQGARSFRLGRDLFDQKFALDIVSQFTAEEIYQKALTTRQEIHSQMIMISKSIWLHYFPDEIFPVDELAGVKTMISEISRQQVRREQLVDSIRQQIPELEQFVISHDLLDLDPTRPLVVRETPTFQRGVAGASVNSPGPYDATADTFYNVTPLDHYSPEQAESYLREYNSRMMQILNIHEAIPGHYTQLVHSNKSPSLVKTLFRNGAMIEGWGLYAERMMLEEGYGNHEPELWLLYYKWLLRSVTNTILDREIHVHNRSRGDAMHMMVNLAFQENTEAEEKWRRATLSQVQLTSYFTGFTEIYGFREEMRQALGDDFKLRDFNNQFLGYGSIPVKYIKAIMRYDLGLAKTVIL